MPRFASGHALLVGVGAYQDARLSAPITIADAAGVANALTNPNVGGYPREQVELLANAQATREGVSAALQRLADRATQTDTVFVFFCGHGALGTDGDYYFATHDAVFVNDQVQAGTGLPSSDLLALLRQIKAQKLLFAINACFSGYVSPMLGSTSTLGVPPSDALGAEILATGEGRALITACRPTQYSRYSYDQPRTFFGQALVDGLRGKAKKSGGYVGLYELYQHIYSSVTAATKDASCIQEPVLTILQNVGPFPVALYPNARPEELDATEIQKTPPPNAAVVTVPQTTVQAIGHRAQTFNIQGSSAVTIDQGRKLIDFGSAKIEGGLSIGDVAGERITKVDVAIGAPNVARADTKQELLALIAQLRNDAAALKGVAERDRAEVVDALRRAKEAGEGNDKRRLLRNLEAARNTIADLGSTIPIAHRLDETLGLILERATKLFA